YTLQQADMDAGTVHNSGTACGTPPQGPSRSVCDTQTTDTPVPRNPALALKKDAVCSTGTSGVNCPAPKTYSAVGQVITYTYTITNSGNVDLPGPFVVTDTIEGVISPCGSGPLAPGASTSCQATHTINQADLDSAQITNVAQAHFGGIDSNEASQTVQSDRRPSIQLIKKDTPQFSVPAPKPGDIIKYDFMITTNANVTLSNPQLSACLAGLPPPSAPPVVCGGVATLVPGASTTCSGDYAITQQDIDHGNVNNTADACADTPPGV